MSLKIRLINVTQKVINYKNYCNNKQLKLYSIYWECICSRVWRKTWGKLQMLKNVQTTRIITQFFSKWLKLQIATPLQLQLKRNLRKLKAIKGFVEICGFQFSLPFLMTIFHLREKCAKSGYAHLWIQTHKHTHSHTSPFLIKKEKWWKEERVFAIVPHFSNGRSSTSCFLINPKTSKNPTIDLT